MDTLFKYLSKHLKIFQSANVVLFLILPMLRHLSYKAQERTFFEKNLNPVSWYPDK